MKILAICKPTGYNFLRHYTENMPDTSVCLTRNPREAWQRIESEKPDVVLFEWANDLTAECLRDRKPNAHTVVRIHDHEVSQIQADGKRRATHVNWSNVDQVWFINKAIQKQFHQEINNRTQSFFLSNAVNPSPFSLAEKQEKRAGLLSLHFRPRKGIMRAAYLAQAVPDWQFHIRVHVPGPGNSEFRPEYDQVMKIAEHLDNLHIEHREFLDVELGAYPFGDVNEWFQDKSVVLSCSYHEGFHYAIAEGALTGAMPIVWNWPTASDFWEPYINRTNSINEAITRLRAFEFGRESDYRRFVVDNYSPAVLIPALYEKIGVCVS